MVQIGDPSFVGMKPKRKKSFIKGAAIFQWSNIEKLKQQNKREKLFANLRLTSACALLSALSGIAMMIVSSELFYHGAHSKSNLIRMVLVANTVILVWLCVKYHIIKFQIALNESRSEYWQSAMTFGRCAQIVVEIVICSFCPIPMYPILDNFQVFLSIAMFARVYWLLRAMLLYSSIYACSFTKSIAGFNHVKTDTWFFVKRMLTLYPGQALISFTLTYWVLGGYTFRLCEWHHEDETDEYKYKNFFNHLWLMAITFLTIGYGDIVPRTYCGRMLAISAGVLGLCISSFMIAVIVRSLELTRAQKNVHNFIIELDHTKRLKHNAARVIQETWRLYKYRRLNSSNRIRRHQRKLLLAIDELRNLKTSQGILEENRISLCDVAKTSLSSLDMVRMLYRTHEELETGIISLEAKLAKIQNELTDFTNLLKVNLNLTEKEKDHIANPKTPQKVTFTLEELA